MENNHAPLVISLLETHIAKLQKKLKGLESSLLDISTARNKSSKKYKKNVSDLKKEMKKVQVVTKDSKQ